MASLPSLRQLEYLAAVARRLNFTHAAADCFVTQSTLSAGIRELEQTLGVQLLERDRQRVLLTGVGRAVLERAETLLAAAHDLANFAATQGDPLAGEVRLGAIPTIAPFLLPEYLRRLRAACPALRVLLREDQTADLLRRVRDGEIDFGIIALPYETGDLLVEPMFAEGLWLVAPPGEFDAAPRIGDIPAERLLLLEEGHCLREHTLAACPTTRASGHALEASSLYTLVQMVETGWGYAVLPEMAVSSGLVERAGLVARRFRPPAPMRTVAVVTRRTTGRRPLFERLTAIGRQHAAVAAERPATTT